MVVRNLWCHGDRLWARSEGLFAVDRVGKVAMGIVACLALWPCSVRGPDRAIEDGFVEGRRHMIEDGKMEIC